MLDGGWAYFVDGGMPIEPGFHIVEQEPFYRAFGENGRMYPPGYCWVDGFWRYILEGSILAKPGVHTEFDGVPRLVLDGGVLAPPGTYIVDGITYTAIDGGGIVQ
jgi:hypothetical protein